MTAADTPFSPRGERTRERIVDAAIGVFADLGEQRGTFSEIARRAGITSQGIYRYFPDKRALYEEAVRADELALQREVNSSLDGAFFPFLTGQYNVALGDAIGRHPLVLRVCRDARPADLALLMDVPTTTAHLAAFADEVRVGQAAGVVRPDVDADRVVAALIRVGIVTARPLSVSPDAIADDFLALEYLVVATLFSPVPDLSVPGAREKLNTRNARMLRAHMKATAGG